MGSKQVKQQKPDKKPLPNTNDISFDPCYQCITSDQYIKSKVQVMKDLYVDVGVEILPNAPKPRGRPVQVNCFVDSDHAGDIETLEPQT